MRESRINKYLELPREAISNVPKITIIGFDEILIENFNGILWRFLCTFLIPLRLLTCARINIKVARFYPLKMMLQNYAVRHICKSVTYANSSKKV